MGIDPRGGARPLGRTHCSDGGGGSGMMRARAMTGLNILLAVMVVIAIPAGIFHATSGRYAQATVALGCALVGACLLWLQWKRPLEARPLEMETPRTTPSPTWAEEPREPGPLPGWLSRSVMSGIGATAT